MAKNIADQDMISEAEYTRKTAFNTSPENDSPGDSEDTAETEFEMGVNFDAEDAEDTETTGYAMDSKDTRRMTEADLPDTAKVVSSELPNPSADQDQESDTH